MTETTYREALRQALTDSMRRDPSIVILGEEVGKYGGAYGVTKGMLEEFGEARIRDTPISDCLLYTSPSPRDGLLSRMPSSA